MSRRRIFLLVLLILVGFTASGSATTLDQEGAEGLLKEVRKTIPSSPTTLDIFGNNLRVALLMLIPGLGLILAPYVLYNTGLVFSATGVVSGMPGLMLLLATSIQPFFWLEFVAYAASTTQNLYLIWAFKSKTFRREARNLMYTLIIVLVTLLLAAWVETLSISS